MHITRNIDCVWKNWEIRTLILKLRTRVNSWLVFKHRKQSFFKRRKTISTVQPQQSALLLSRSAVPAHVGGTKFDSTKFAEQNSLLELSRRCIIDQISIPRILLSTREHSILRLTDRCLRSGDVLSQSPLFLSSPSLSISLSLFIFAALSDIPCDRTVNRALISREEKRGIKSWTDVYPRWRLARAG